MFPNIILLNDSEIYFRPIENRIVRENIPVTFLHAHSYEKALSLIPKVGKSIVITDSHVGNSNENESDKMVDFAKEIRKDYPNCFIIVYAPTFFDLDERLFNFCIDSLEPFSVNELVRCVKKIVLNTQDF